MGERRDSAKFKPSVWLHMPLSELIMDIYRRHGLEWARLRGATPGDEVPWLDRFCALLPPGGTILDLGCGTGQSIAAALVQRGFRITGVDTAPAMLALAQAVIPEQEWLEQDMRQVDLRRRFDGVLAWDSFFHLSHADQRAMFPRFANHSRCGAPLLFTSGPEHGEAVGTLAGESLYHASLDPGEYRNLLASHGFRVIEHRSQNRDSGGRTVWLAQKM